MLLKTFSGLYLTGLALTARCRQQQRRKSLGGETTTLCGERGECYRYWELLQGQLRFKYSSLFI